MHGGDVYVRNFGILTLVALDTQAINVSEFFGNKQEYPALLTLSREDLAFFVEPGNLGF